jgi:hypothetical protein
MNRFKYQWYEQTIPEGTIEHFRIFFNASSKILWGNSIVGSSRKATKNTHPPLLIAKQQNTRTMPGVFKLSCRLQSGN